MCGTSSHTAVFVGKRKICWDENFGVNSFTKILLVRRTTRPHFLVVLISFLVAEDTRTLEFCYPTTAKRTSGAVAVNAV